MLILEAFFRHLLSSRDLRALNPIYHAHNEGEFELHFFIEGDGFFLNNNIRYPIQQQMIFLTGPYEFHQLFPAEPKNLMTTSYYTVKFFLKKSDHELLDLLTLHSRSDGAPLPLDNGYHVIFDEIIHLSPKNDVFSQKAATHQLLSFLYGFYGVKHRNPKESEHSQLDMHIHVHVNRALSIMRREVKSKLSIAVLAGEIGLSEEYLIRLFRKQMKISPHQYFTRLKIMVAAEYLIRDDKTIRETSEIFGFESEFHFSRVFHKCTGLPPSLYRKIHQQN